MPAKGRPRYQDMLRLCCFTMHLQLGSVQLQEHLYQKKSNAVWVTLDRLCPDPNAAQLPADGRPNGEAHNIGLLLWAFALSKV